MKSTKEQLKSRGKAFDDDIDSYKKCNETELLELLHSHEAYKRTIGIKLLHKLYRREEYIPLFCDMLKEEDKLYTRIELRNTLAEYEEKSIPYILPLLGIIGNNQHKQIGIVDDNKPSYPCPRDLAAGVLIRIGEKALPYLKTFVVESKNKKAIYEAIDAIGFISWHSNNIDMENLLINCWENNKEDALMKWKLIRAFQSFNTMKIKNILEDTLRNNEDDIIKKEAKRSMERMNNRKKSSPHCT
jgi:hypothetical protein